MSVSKQASIFFEDGWVLAEEIIHEVAHDKRKLTAVASLAITAVGIATGRAIKGWHEDNVRRDLEAVIDDDRMVDY